MSKKNQPNRIIIEEVDHVKILTRIELVHEQLATVYEMLGGHSQGGQCCSGAAAPQKVAKHRKPGKKKFDPKRPVITGRIAEITRDALQRKGHGATESGAAGEREAPFPVTVTDIDADGLGNFYATVVDEENSDEGQLGVPSEKFQEFQDWDPNDGDFMMELDDEQLKTVEWSPVSVDIDDESDGLEDPEDLEENLDVVDEQHEELSVSN